MPDPTPSPLPPTKRVRRPRVLKPNGQTFDLAPPPPSKRLHHPSREVSDFELRGAIKPLVLTPEKLIFLTDFTIQHVGKWNDSIRNADPRETATRIIAAAPGSFELGAWQGVASFVPLYPGHDAMVHLAIWDPMFLRRLALGQALLRHAMQKWHLRRIYSCLPEPHRLANRLCANLGMTLEGRLRHAFVYNGQPVTGMYWAILAEEV